MAIAAAAGLIVSAYAPFASAQQKTDVQLTGNCSISINPDGSFSVNCVQGTGTQTPPPCSTTNTCTKAGAFAFTQSTASAPVNTQVALFVSRTGGTDGSVIVPLTFTGECFWGANQSSVDATFAPGQATLGFYATTTANNGTCTIGFGTPRMSSGSTTDIGPTASGTIALTVGSGPSNPSIPGCPATPLDMQTNTFLGPGNWFPVTAKSGQITAIPLPATQPNYVSGMVSFGESPLVATPQPVTLSISINKCPGVIDTDTTNHCNVTSSGGAQNNITWFSAASSAAGVLDATTANQRGYCWAPAGETFYVNMKWTYSQCANFAQSCGFTVLQNYGPY